MRLKHSFTAWIAVSFYGHPAPFLGYAFTRKELKEDYARLFPTSSFDRAGYTAVKVTMTRVNR